MVSATIATVFAKSRLTAIISLGVVGYTLALFFVIFRAPDLALTQLVIETISVALFLLCFYHLPKMRRKKKTRTFRMTNFIISLGVGVIVTMLGIASSSEKTKDSISSFFTAYSHKLGEETISSTSSSLISGDLTRCLKSRCCRLPHSGFTA